MAGAGYGAGAWRWQGNCRRGYRTFGLAGARVVGRRYCVVIFEGGKAFIGVGCVYECNILESIIMTMRPPTTETNIVLRTILSAGVLAVLLVLACAGAAAGVVTWVVDDDGGADFASIPMAAEV